MMFLDLMPVVEKPEIVKAKEQKLKSLGQKYVVKLLIFCTNEPYIERCTKCEAQDCGPLFKCSVTKSTSKNVKMAAVLPVKFHLI